MTKLETTRITRVEVIDENGRSYVNWKDDNDVSWQFQDDGKTLKIFVNKVKPKTLFDVIRNLGYSFDAVYEIVDAIEEFEKSKGYPSTLQQPETSQERGERIHKEMEELVNKLQEKEWNIKVVTDYLTGKARHKMNIVDKDGNDYKPEPITTEELLKPDWEPSAQTPEQVEEGLRSAMRQAKEDGVFDEQENDKSFKSSLDLIREWGEKNKPPNLKELVWEWWEDIFTRNSDLDADASIDMLVDMIDKKFIPPSHDTNGYEWEKCLKMMRDKLR